MRRLPWLIVLLLVLLLGAGGYYVYVRYILMNFHPVVQGKVYRSAQPSPDQLAAWIPRYGLKTILDLRGESHTQLAEEEAVARQHGAAFIILGLSSTEVPTSVQLMRLAEVLETAEKPLLLHCQEGADRSGLASVMARMAVGGKPYDRAKEQMGLKFLHIDPAPDHVAAVMTEYEVYCRNQKVGTGGWPEFRQWIFHTYRPSFYYVVFDVPPELTARPGEDMHLAVRFVNRSSLAIPAGDPKRRLALVVSLDEPREEEAGKWLPTPVPLAPKDIPPGGESTMDVHLTVPARTGEFVLLFDLQDEEGLPFHHQGSVPGILRLKVSPASPGPPDEDGLSRPGNRFASPGPAWLPRFNHPPPCLRPNALLMAGGWTIIGLACFSMPT